MSGKLFKPEQPKTATNTGDHYYQTIAKLVSYQPVAASQGILLDIHIDPQIPAQVSVESELAQKTLLPLITRAIEHTPWSRLDISFHLVNVFDSEYHVEMNIWGNGCPLRQYEINHRMVLKHTTIANSNAADVAKPATGRQASHLDEPRHLATSRFKVQLNSDQPLSWQVTNRLHEATLLLSDNPILGERVGEHLNRYNIMTNHADSLMNACRTIVTSSHKMTYSTVLVDARLGDKTLNKYSPLLHDVASPGSKFILLTHNEINHNLIQKYHAAGYFAVVNLEVETELANAMYAATTFYAKGSVAKKCAMSGSYMAQLRSPAP